MIPSKITYYVKRFQDIYNGKPWYGETIETKLTDVSEDNAFTKPNDATHSIAEIVSHMTYWRKALVSRLEGDQSFSPSMKSEDNWPPIDKLKAMGWEKVRDDFNTTQQKITELLAKQSDEFLEEEYGKSYTFDSVIQGIIDHDVYHLGQIGLVKRMIGG